MKKYDDEFKQQTLKKVFDGQSVASVSNELGIAESNIHKWKRAALGDGAGEATADQVREAVGLRKRVTELEAEVEILKKAALIFGRAN